MRRSAPVGMRILVRAPRRQAAPHEEWIEARVRRIGSHAGLREPGPPWPGVATMMATLGCRDPRPVGGGQREPVNRVLHEDQESSCCTRAVAIKHDVRTRRSCRSAPLSEQRRDAVGFDADVQRDSHGLRPMSMSSRPGTETSSAREAARCLKEPRRRLRRLPTILGIRKSPDSRTLPPLLITEVADVGARRVPTRAELSHLSRSIGLGVPLCHEKTRRKRRRGHGLRR